MGKTEINGIAEAILYVDDIQAAEQFYTNVLGLPLTASFTDSRFLQTGKHSTLIIFERTILAARSSIIPAHGAVGDVHVALTIPQAQYTAWKQRLLNHQVVIEHEHVWPGGARSIYFRDPDNNSLELMEGHHYPAVWQRVQQNESVGGNYFITK